MMASLRSALVLLLISVFLAIEDLIPVPSCKISSSESERGERDGDGLKVMMVADLFLKGSDPGFVDRFFRDQYTSKFLKKSLERLKPDMLLVLGDISAKGSELTEGKFLTILQQFQGMLGPSVGIPLHILLGDRDIGECSKLDANFVSDISSHLPGLNSVGCGAFVFRNISFVSLNAIALLCGDNDLRFGVEKVIENEHLELQNQMQDSSEAPSKTNTLCLDFSKSYWRANYAASGSGPVVLFHLPLHRSKKSKYGGTDNIGDHPCVRLTTLVDSGLGDAGPYDLIHTLPPNATEYIFHSLKPRIVFSAHAHHFCDYSHIDGTREVIVPSMTWAGNGDPGFIMAKFGHNNAVTVSHCSLAKESPVTAAYLSISILLIATMLIGRCCL